MTEPMAADVFADRGRRLRVWFDEDGVDPFTDLGMTAIAAVPYALNAETLDGLDGIYYDQHYDHVVVVAKSGGDFTTINAALESITDNGEFSRYLVWVAPGTYSETVVMKPYVSIQGAGAGATVLFSMAGSETFPPPATVVLTEYVTLRDVAVVVTGTGRYKIAIAVMDVAADTAEVSEVRVQAFGDEFVYGIFNDHAAPVIRDVSLNVSAVGQNVDAIGIYGYVSSPTIESTMVIVNAAVYGFPVAHNAYAYGIWNDNSTAFIHSSVITVSSTSDGHHHAAIGIENGDSEVTIRDALVTVGPGKSSIGIHINAVSTATIQNTTVYAEAFSDAIAIKNGYSSMTVQHVVADAVGAIIGRGISTYEGPMTVQNSIASGSASPEGCGIYVLLDEGMSSSIQNTTATGSVAGLCNESSGHTFTVTVDSSYLAGGSWAIDSDDEVVTYVGTSMLDGGVDGVGTYHCIFAYDENYTALDASCQAP
jgi:hypothetical protein